MALSSDPPVSTRRDRWLRLALLAGVLAALGLFYALGLHRYLSWEVVRKNIASLEEQVAEHLVLAVVLFFVVYVAVTALSLPAAGVLSLVAGAIFDFWLGVAVVSLASTSGATLAFLGSRYLFRDWVRRRFGTRLEAIDRGFQRDGAWYLFTLRLNVVVPFFLINLGMGLTPLRAGTFVLVSWVGMLPATLVIVNAGKQIGRIEKPSDALSPAVIVSLALLGIVPLAIRLLLRWVGQRRPA
jgi:uncharacterized membrane protein YdjX (TVP38/TMEM64 family)